MNRAASPYRAISIDALETSRGGGKKSKGLEMGKEIKGGKKRKEENLGKI